MPRNTGDSCQFRTPAPARPASACEVNLGTGLAESPSRARCEWVLVFQGLIRMMKQLARCATCVAVLMSMPAVSRAQTQNTYAENQTTFQGTVEAVDYQVRTVTIRGSEGNVVALDVPTSATRFSEIKVGDHVTA